MIKRILILSTAVVLAFGLKACVDPFFAEIEEEAKIIVIEGSIILGDSVQRVEVSSTTTLLDPRPDPIGSCNVTVLDDLGNSFPFYESEKGVYLSDTPDGSLETGREYMVRVVSPGGQVYESEFDLLNPTAPVDTTYWAIERLYNSLTDTEQNGIQFYIDIKADESVPRYFRWVLEETYEYTVGGPLSYWYRDAWLVPIPPKDPLGTYRCWLTQRVDGLYLSNTINLASNEKKKIPLQYVSTDTDKLRIKYSVLVNQYSMNENAYAYWQQNRSATEESGGLYTSQPAQPISNICNISDPDEQVLGFFWAAARSSQRLIVPRPGELPVQEVECVLYQFDPLIHKNFPILIRIDEETGLEMTGNDECFDCQLRGGSLVKPDFMR